MHIIIIGNPVDGLQFIGPFDSKDAAINHANHDGNIDADWWIAAVEAPTPSGMQEG